MKWYADSQTYNNLIYGFRRCGNFEKCLEIYQFMKDEKQLTELTTVSMIHAASLSKPGILSLVRIDSQI